MLMFLLMALVACSGPKKLPKGMDSAAAVAQMQQAQMPYAIQARFNVKLTGANFSGATVGALIMHWPDRFRIEIQTPLRTPLLYLVSDGDSLNAWIRQDNVFFRGDDATAVMHSLTGGAIDVKDMFALFTGNLPMSGAEVLYSKDNGDGTVTVVLQGPEGYRIRAIIEPRFRIVRELVVARELEGAASPLVMGTTLFRVEYWDLMHFGGKARMPEEFTVELPTLGWTLEIEVHTWDEMGVIPEVFSLAPPPHSVEKDLVQTLMELADKQGATLPSQ
jgi:outer membrane biogenesis lipoprotein LolB